MRIDYIGYALAVVGILAGFIISYYFYLKSIRIKEPVYSIRSNRLISDHTSVFTDLVVSYRGQRVKNFTFSTVLFFNRGAVTIDRTDIASLNPLRIVPKDCRILDTRISAANNPANGFTLVADEKGDLRIDFEYLNQNDGVVLSIIHDGLSSKNIDVVGDMKEVKSLRRVSPRRMRGASSAKIPMLFLPEDFPFLALLSIPLMAALVGIGILQEAVGELSLNVILPILGSAVTVALFTFTLYLFSRSRSVVIPKGLEIFDE